MGGVRGRRKVSAVFPMILFTPTPALPHEGGGGLTLR